MSARADYAPGPWQEAVTKVVDAQGALVALITDRSESLENKALIAAAPDLLAALVEMIRLANDCYTIETIDGGEITHPSIVRARAAVEKARGES